MKMVLNRVDGDYGMEVFSESGQCVSFDAAEKIGGKDFGIRPMEGVLSSLAACSSIDVLLILKKQKLEPITYSVEINAERVDAVPSIFKKIHLTFNLKGKLPKEKVQRAVELSMTKYCSVVKILETTCQISYSITLETNNK